jgi:outer membrane protein assembly factor BamB
VKDYITNNQSEDIVCGNDVNLPNIDTNSSDAIKSPDNKNSILNIINPAPKSVLINLNTNGKSIGHELLWTANTTGMDYEESICAYVDGTVYIASNSNHADGHNDLFALNATTGEILWSYPTGPSYVGPDIDGDVLYLGTSYHGYPGMEYMYAINRTTGQEKWKVVIDGGVANSVKYDENKVYFCSFWETGMIYALNKENGSINWTYNTKQQDFPPNPKWKYSYCANTLMLRDNALYATFFSPDPSDIPSGKLYKLNVDDGSAIWKVALADGPWDNSITYDGDGRLFLAIYYDGTMNAYWDSNGSLIWSYPLHGHPLSFNGYHNGVVFIADTDGYVYALNSTNGVLIWRKRIGNVVDISSPTIADGKIFIATRDGSEGAFFIMNETTGVILWKYTVGVSVTASPSIADGMMFCGTDGWNMYAFDVGVGTGDWLLHRYDNWNTGYSPDGLTEWQYVEANCTTNNNITKCIITNYYDHNVTNITLNLGFSADWLDDTGNLLKEDSDNYTISDLSSSSSMTLFICDLMSYNISLSEGWNLVSLPLFQIAEPIGRALNSIEGKWDCIQVYNSTDLDHWKTNATFKPDQLNDLKSLNHKIGFWLHATEACTLTVIGTVPASTNIQFYVGWNLVGYPSLAQKSISDALLGTGFDSVEGFNASDPYRMSVLPGSYMMKPGEGYWVHVPADTTWVVDW